MKQKLKRLYYRYFDLFQMSHYMGDYKTEFKAHKYMDIVKKHIKNIELFEFKNRQTYADKHNQIIRDFKELVDTGTISYIELYKTKIPEWVYPVIRYSFLNIENFKQIVDSSECKNSREFLRFINSKGNNFLNAEQIEDLNYVFSNLNSNFSLLDSKNFNFDQKIGKFYGTLHNHTTYSDGQLSVAEIKDEALKRGYEYIGISDHSQEYLLGCDENQFLQQMNEIKDVNNESSIRILSGIECEILADGKLDFSPSFLSSFDFVIIGNHTDYNVNYKQAMVRMISAIESPNTNILAHPTSRIFNSKPGLNLDLKSIIDACVTNKVAIEINGSPKRLDLDLRYVPYAVKRNATFILSADSHSLNSFDNIDNALAIANNIPKELILNYKPLNEVINFFKKRD